MKHAAPSPFRKQTSNLNKKRAWTTTFTLLLISIAALAAFGSGVFLKPSQAKQDLNWLTPQVAEQIQALQAEKEARTPAQRKIDSQLLYAIKMSRGEAI